MDYPSLDSFKPEWKRLTATLMIFLLSAFEIWMPLLKGLIDLKDNPSPSIHISQFLILAIMLIASYVLSSILITKFDWKYIKETPLTLKFIITCLALKVVWLVINIIISFFLPSRQFIYMTHMLYGAVPTITIILLLASMIFMLIDLRWGWLLSSSYFIYLTLNPFTDPSAPYWTGYVFSIIHLVGTYNLIGLTAIIAAAFLPVASLIYLIAGLRTDFRNERFGEAMFFVLIAAYITPIIVSSIIQFYLIDLVLSAIEAIVLAAVVFIDIRYLQ